MTIIIDDDGIGHKVITLAELDKIRAEIIQIPTISFNANDIYKADVLKIIDKYKSDKGKT